MPCQLVIDRESLRKFILLPIFHPELVRVGRAEIGELEVTDHDLGPSNGQILAAMSEYGVEDEDMVYFESRAEELPWDLPKETDSNKSFEDLIVDKIHGPASLKQKLKGLVYRYRHLFKRTINQEPAEVPPLTFKVDETKWTRAYTAGPRPQSVADREEIRIQVEEMLHLGIIKESSSPHASQVLMVPKPNTTKKRFCVDMRRLNTCIEDQHWPIPVIRETLDRIGENHPRFFAKFDFPMGYFQCPLAEECTKYCAFICWLGIFEFIRIPMGLKVAGAFFQRIMTTIVLAGLVFIICESYLDDITTYGGSDDELVKNIEAIFKRLEKHKLVLHPDKWVMGVSEIDFLGYTIDANGIRHNEKRIQNVKDFATPSTKAQLKSFLGLVNFFRDHIKDFSTISKPLYLMVDSYTKRDRHQRLIWSSDQLQVFENVKAAVEQCQKLYYLKKDAPVVLETDASDYGIGAYLYQVINQKQFPVRFLSKSLSRPQLKWSTPEKECYAIFYAFVKFEHLLRDIHFTLRTDHQNLVRIYDSGSKMVLRMRLAMQEFNFTPEYIKGIDNDKADQFSRLCSDISYSCYVSFLM